MPESTPALTHPELDRCMARLAEGDRAAFDPLYTALYPRALRTARWRLSEAHAADVAQSAMLRVFARASEFEPGRPVLPWFYALVANEVRAVLRSPHVARTELRGDPGESTRAEGDPEQALLEHELHLSLEHAIHALDAGSVEALSVVLGRAARPPSLGDAAFRKRVSRAYSRLRALLGGV